MMRLTTSSTLIVSTVWLQLLALPSSAEPSQEPYDDSRRMGCRLELNDFAWKQHPEINDAMTPYLLDGMRLQILVSTKDLFIDMISYPDEENPITIQYKESCERNGGTFVVATGVLDFTNKDKSVTTLLEDNGTCFPPGEACKHYTDSANVGDWEVDTQHVLNNTCTFQPANNIDDAVKGLQSDSPMPKGEPVFSNIVPSYNEARRQTCMEAFTKILTLEDDQYDELTDAIFSQSGRQQVELLQYSPVLTTREWYLEDAATLPYPSLCEESGGTFDTFSGVLDCVNTGSKKKGTKSTQVIENAATCFPKTGCEGYTLAQWKLDTTLFSLNQACTIRQGSEKSTTLIDDGESNDSNDSNDNDGPGIYFPILMGIGGALVGFAVFSFCQRRKEKKTAALEEGTELPSYRDNKVDDQDLPSVA